MLEDGTGRLTAVVPKGSRVADTARGLVLDEVVGLHGSYDTDRKVLVADLIEFPDVEEQSTPLARERICAAFVSDLHFGSPDFMREEFDEFNLRQERNRLLLARAVDVQREQDRRLQWAALQALARGLGEDSAKQQRAIGELYAMIGSGEVHPASYVEPQRRD